MTLIAIIATIIVSVALPAWPYTVSVVTPDKKLCGDIELQTIPYN